MTDKTSYMYAEDEPAEILLRRIHDNSKKKLILEKDGLPEGWVKLNVEQIYDIVGGYLFRSCLNFETYGVLLGTIEHKHLNTYVGGSTPSTKIEEYWKGNIPWISSTDIHDLYDIRPRRKITIEAGKNSATNIVPTGSLITVTRVGLGKIACASMPICFSQDLQALVGNDSITDPHYATYYLSQAVQIFKHDNRGTTISGVTKKQLAELTFFLSSLNEQKRIVSKIESIFSKIDAKSRILYALMDVMF